MDSTASGAVSRINCRIISTISRYCGKTLACTICHGADLKGLAPAPPIAGRSPTYLARALYDFKAGARNGPGGAQLMKPVAAGLDLDDMVALAAYIGSLAP